MGRTRRTLRDQFDALEREWQPFRRSLRRRHQPAFDRLFEHARGHADAAGQQNAPDSWRAFAFAVLLAQEREIAEREETVATLADTLAQQRDEIDALRDRVETLEAERPVEDDATAE